MDLASVIGYLMCFVLIIISIMLSAGPTGIKSFIDAPSMLITIGGSFMVVFASNTVESFIAGLKILPVYMKAPASDTASIIKQIVELSNAARKEGLLALEGTAREMDDKFMQKGLLLVVDGTEPEMVKSVMEAEIDTIDARHKERIQVFEDLAAQGPAWGMIGTLIGLILMLKNMSDPSSIGPSMAVALITTMYGSMLANWICFPVSTKMKKRNDAEITLKGIIVEGLMSIQAGENPRTTEEKLKSFLSPQQRDAYEAENGSGSAGGE